MARSSDLSEMMAVGAIVTASALVFGLMGAVGAITMIPSVLYLVPALSGARPNPHIVTSLGFVQRIVVGIGSYRHWRDNRVSARLLIVHGAMSGLGGIARALLAA